MDYLTVAQAAELKGCSDRYIKQLCKDGKLHCIVEINDRKRPKYMIPVSSLPDDLQARYYDRQRREAGIEPELKAPSKESKKTVKKVFEDFSEVEREEISAWINVLNEWQECRRRYKKKSEADELFITKYRLENPEEPISMDILYRKWAAYKQNDLAGILGKRGGSNKGTSSIPTELWDYFKYLYLCDSKPTVSRCYTLLGDWTADFYPELVPFLPAERTFRRHIDSDIPLAVQIYMREGDKAMRDKCMPYISRMYDKLMPTMSGSLITTPWISSPMTILARRTDYTSQRFWTLKAAYW